MRKLIIAAAAAFIYTLASAGDYDGPRFSVRLGVSGKPSTAYDLFCEKTGSDSWSLSGIYGQYHGDTKVLPPVTLELGYSLTQWFMVSLNLGYANFSHDTYTAISNEVSKHRKGSVIYAIPEGRFNYFSNDLFKVYGAFGFGIGIYNGFDTSNTKHRLEAQCIPAGVEFGRSLFCFAECGFGTLYNGVRGGVGFRF